MKIFIASDHAGFDYKQSLIQSLSEKGHEIRDFGTSDDTSVDYPDYVHPLCKEMQASEEVKAILICGSGNGVAMTANKYAHIRAALCWNKDITRLARIHNNANVLALPARMISIHLAMEMVEIFLTTPFEGGRHDRRVNKIPCI